ncbi:multidrug efflux SMR transporter [Nocardioides aquiterrae]|uniref:Multidrug efflux SMR transporter n=1 Tax=Nocardioides aquiterrae TaxID=203799 RepID=A0ABP4F139_9ACTN
MAYVWLTVAIGFEVLGTSLLKPSEGLTKLWPSMGAMVSYLLACGMLAQAMREIPTGVAYAMWSGLGTAAIVSIGLVFLGDNLTTATVSGIALIVGGVIVLNLAGAH